MSDLGLWVYIAKCADGSYYVGSTKLEPEARVWEHNEGLHPGAYTFSRRPVVLVFSERYERLIDGFARERQIKGWSRAKKEALIARDWDELQRLARTAKPKGSVADSDADSAGNDWTPGNE
jgi:putative endonuclease